MTSNHQYLWALTITEVPIFWIFKLLYITSRMCLVRSFRSSRFMILYIKMYFFPWLLLTDPYIRQYVFSTTGGITCSSSYNIHKPSVPVRSCKALLYFSVKYNNITHAYTQPTPSADSSQKTPVTPPVQSSNRYDTLVEVTSTRRTKATIVNWNYKYQH